jgi:acyl CoA:acetate/3-ketoacid CoA transferase beta subunit|tara:strand:- start:29492 stop:31951 length:2460 start_codon:yes stop_codon:yes gene_type:complete
MAYGKYPNNLSGIPQEIIDARVSSKSKNRPEDPTGQYPETDYFFSSNISKEARGVARNDLEFFAQYDDVELETGNKVSSVYGKNQVSKSEKGHVWEVDDTDGNERILIKHIEGSGIELTPDGSIIISTKKRKVEVIGGSNEVIVEGDAQLVYKGNLNIKVVGEFNVDCLDYNVKVNGNKVETIRGSEEKHVGNGSQSSVTGPITTYSTGLVTDVFLGGHQHNVKGNLDYNINGNVGLFSSGTMDVTSEDYLNMSADNFTASANNMTLQGGTGVIGGTAMDFVGNGAIFDQGVKAPTFHGDLKGTATTATVAQSQNYADPNGGGGVGTAGTITDTATPSITAPTSTKVLTYLLKAAGGIRKVIIDKGDYIKNFIDKSNDYSGVSNGYMTTGQARSKLRDVVNSGNAQFVGQLLKENLICSDYNNPLPERTGRTVRQESTPVLSTMPANIYSPQISATFITKRSALSIVPEEKYNPLRQDDITIKTKLSDNITIAKFLGSDDSTNLKFIKSLSVKRDIAKNLYAHSLILKKIQNNNERFRGVNLVVSEGVYRPSASEIITPNSINDLKAKGKAVVYKAINRKGKPNNLDLFDIAEYLKDVSFFDEMILSYDTLECVGDQVVLSSRLIIVMPDIDDQWTGTFRRKISTEYNRQLLSEGEFIECLLETTETLEERVRNKSATPPTDNVVTHTRGNDRIHWPDQRIVDSIAEAVRELGEGYTAQITSDGGRAKRDSGTNNHPVGEAADHFLLLDGVRINPSQNKILYQRYIRILVRNAKARGVRPGIGGYSTFIHYDESEWRQAGADDAGTWSNGFNVSFAKIV